MDQQQTTDLHKYISDQYKRGSLIESLDGSGIYQYSGYCYVIEYKESGNNYAADHLNKNLVLCINNKLAQTINPSEIDIYEQCQN